MNLNKNRTRISHCLTLGMIVFTGQLLTAIPASADIKFKPVQNQGERDSNRQQRLPKGVRPGGEGEPVYSGNRVGQGGLKAADVQGNGPGNVPANPGGAARPLGLKPDPGRRAAPEDLANLQRLVRQGTRTSRPSKFPFSYEGCMTFQVKGPERGHMMKSDRGAYQKTPILNRLINGCIGEVDSGGESTSCNQLHTELTTFCDNEKRRRKENGAEGIQVFSGICPKYNRLPGECGAE